MAKGLEALRIDEIDFTGRVKLDGYGGGGFRLSGHFHQGSLLLLPEGPKAWVHSAPGALTFDDFADLIAARAGFEVALIGMGAHYASLPKALRQNLAAAGLAFDIMDTGAACRTFNVLIAEDRRVAAALIAFD